MMKAMEAEQFMVSVLIFLIECFLIRHVLLESTYSSLKSANPKQMC